jgi:leucyl aminopeptidase (aminopeptidase T)
MLIDPLGMPARNIAELGIGTNDKAIITGLVLEDEKVMGTIHIAIGDNSHFGGKVQVPSHLDGIVKSPTVWADGKLIMKDGEFMI